MSRTQTVRPENVPRVTIHIGGLHTSRAALVLDTVLGSCIATCLYDPVAGIGGMNHFMLPEGIDPGNPNSTRYGVHAMELLISELMKLGGHRKRFQAKVFGGGHVLKLRESLDGVPQRNIQFARRFLDAEQIPVVKEAQRNIQFARRFLDAEQIPVVKEDVGGYQPRRVVFHTHTSRVFVKYLGSNDAERTAQEEMVYLISLKKRKVEGDVELF